MRCGYRVLIVLRATIAIARGHSASTALGTCLRLADGEGHVIRRVMALAARVSLSSGNGSGQTGVQVGLGLVEDACGSRTAV